MTGGPSRRWDDDSPEEDAAAHQAVELARLEQWIREEKVRPVTDALSEHGMLPGDDDGWAGPVILPPVWDQVPEPHGQCMECQRPGLPSPCGECRSAREQDDDPAATWVWWAGLSPAQRRLHIAASYGIDPWTGQHCTIRMEWTDVGSGGEVRTTYPPYFGCAPAGIYWGARRRG